jgi:hypothetical protein
MSQRKLPVQLIYANKNCKLKKSYMEKRWGIIGTLNKYIQAVKDATAVVLMFYIGLDTIEPEPSSSRQLSPSKPEM